MNNEIRSAETEAMVALAAGEQLATLGQTVRRANEGDVPFILAQDGVKVESVEGFMANPVRKRVVVDIKDAASFIAYVKRFSDTNSLVFANIGDRTITAVLDYHEAGDGKPRWGGHRAQLTCLLTEDWKRWTAANKKPQNQMEFAQFLEDNLPNIAAPAGAFVLEVVKNLEAKKAVKFESSVRLDNGQHQLTYEETIVGQSKGHIDIPQTFTLGIQPFEGAGLYQLEARLRYRIDGGKLSMWFDLVRHEAVVEDAFRETRMKISAGIEPVQVLAAAAPK